MREVSTIEELLNAISHRDYQLAGSVFVRQYRGKLVMESPGGFPCGTTVENILDRQSPRNLLIAKIFQLCGLVERSGQGMNLIDELAIREAKPLPDFSGTDDYILPQSSLATKSMKRYSRSALPILSN